MPRTAHAQRADDATQELGRLRAQHEDQATQLRATRTSLHEESANSANLATQLTELQAEVEQLRAAGSQRKGSSK